MLQELDKYIEDGYHTINYDISGMGFLTIITNDTNTYLERIDIDDEYQCQGIGTNAIFELVKMYGTIYAAPDNVNSQRLFARIGIENTEKYWMVNQGFGVYELK